MRCLKGQFYVARQVFGVYFTQESDIDLKVALSKLEIPTQPSDSAKTGSPSDQSKSFKLIGFPSHVTKEMLRVVDHDYLQPKQNTHTVYAVKAYWRYQVGVLSSNKDLTNWHQDTGILHLPNSLTISRAYHKIAEALSDVANSPFCLQTGAVGENTEDTKTKRATSPPSVRFKALDIGASPGGWSSFLASRGGEVLSLDPGLLKLSPKEHPCHTRITHVPKLAKDAEKEMKEKGPFDVVVCDANIPPVQACSMLVEISQMSGVMARDCRVMVTLKMHDRQKKVFEDTRAKALKVLNNRFKVFRSYHLFSNSHREWTVLATQRHV